MYVISFEVHHVFHVDDVVVVVVLFGLRHCVIRDCLHWCADRRLVVDVVVVVDVVEYWVKVAFEVTVGEQLFR